MIRRLAVAFAALALLGTVACGGGEKKDDTAPTEQPTSAPMEEEAPAEEAPAEEAPAEEAPAEDAPAEEAPEAAEGAEG